MKLLELLKAMFGKSYLNKIIGTGTNVTKPIKLDKNSPFKKYSDSAFEDPKVIDFIEEKLMEYGPYALSNKNPVEIDNFIQNSERYIAAKSKQTGTTEGMKKSMEPKPEAEVFDIGTKKKVDESGIMQLKDELGLPEGVEPGSIMAKAIKERADIKRGTDDTLKKAVDTFFGGMKNQSKVFDEGRRRPIIRQILSEEDVIKKNLSTEEYDDLLFGRDLDKGADPNKDPFAYLNKYFVRDEDQLDMLDTIIDEMPGSTPAEISAEFKKRTGGLRPKEQPVQRESLDDEAVEISETSELPDSDDDIPFAQGGRVGFSKGGIKALIEMMNKKFGKDTVKTADEVELTNDMVLAKETRRALEELKDYKDIAPQFYQRMTLKLKYPGISDELIAKIMADDNPQRVAEVMATMDEAFKMMDKGMSSDEILKTFKNTPRTKNAGGGLNYLMGM